VHLCHPCPGEIRSVAPNSPPQLVNLGSASGNGLREWIDNQMHEKVKKHRHRNPRLLEYCRHHRSKMEEAARIRARLY
jgi:hypothetical protein